MRIDQPATNNHNTNQLIRQELPHNEDQPAGHQRSQYKLISIMADGPQVFTSKLAYIAV